MRITLLNQKGGVGKSTVALLLAAVLKNEADYDVALDDRDPQGTASFFAERFGVPLLASRPDPAAVVTDTPGHMRLGGEAGEELRNLIAASDVLLLVVDKSPAAVHATMPMAALIRDAKRPDARAFVLFNRVRSATAIGRQDGRELAEAFGLPALKNELPQASAYENALATGFSAVRGKHREILLKLALEVMK